jgi:hypothetical protein
MMGFMGQAWPCSKAMKLNLTRWVVFVARVVDKTHSYSIFIGNLEGKSYLGGLGLYGRKTLKLFLKNNVWSGFICLRIGTGGGLL